jgi:hypothetical protein
LPPSAPLPLLSPAEVVVNEDCPRYNFLCDFVNVSGELAAVQEYRQYMM